MHVEYDRQVDAVDVSLSQEPSVLTRVIDNVRLIDYDAAGNLVGLEFLDASCGVRLGGLPLQVSGVDVAELARGLGDAGVPVLDDLVATTPAVASASMNAGAIAVSGPKLVVISARHQSRITDFSAGLVRP